MVVNIIQEITRHSGSDGKIVIGKDTPPETLYLYELGKAINHTQKTRFDSGKQDIERLHQMAMEVINASKK